MKAARIHGPGNVSYDTVDDPKIEQSRDVEGKVKLDDIITHRLPLSEIAHGYKIFKEKEEDYVK